MHHTPSALRLTSRHGEWPLWPCLSGHACIVVTARIFQHVHSLNTQNITRVCSQTCLSGDACIFSVHPQTMSGSGTAAAGQKSLSALQVLVVSRFACRVRIYLPDTPPPNHVTWLYPAIYHKHSFCRAEVSTAKAMCWWFETHCGAYNCAATLCHTTGSSALTLTTVVP